MLGSDDNEGRLQPWVKGVVEKLAPEMYVLRHAVKHTLACADAPLLKNTLLHPGYMLSKVEALGPAALASDYVSRTALADPDMKLCQQALALAQRVIMATTIAPC